jgi:hypothetical protein
MPGGRFTPIGRSTRNLTTRQTQRHWKRTTTIARYPSTHLLRLLRQRFPLLDQLRPYLISGSLSNGERIEASTSRTVTIRHFSDRVLPAPRPPS